MPDLNDAIALLKAGDHAGAQRMMNQIVGLPANTPLDKSASTPPPSAKDAMQLGMMRGKPMGPAMARPGMARPAMGGRPFAKGGSVGSASKRADGCAQRGKTKGKMV